MQLDTLSLLNKTQLKLNSARKFSVNLSICNLFWALFFILNSLNIAYAAKPSKTISFASSLDAGDVVINEININQGYVELYFVEATDVTNWTLYYDGQGNNDGSANLCSSSCAYPAGTFLVVDGISLHNTLEELLLLDKNNLAVHYFRYANHSNQGGGKWKWITDDPAISTIYYVNGAKFNLCSKPDGQFSGGDWQECNSTKGGPNDGTPIHHYEIVHDANGSTCSSETITVRACTDANCTGLSAEAVQVDLVVNGSVIQTLSFTGSTTASFSYGIENTVTFALANPSVAPDNAFACDDGSGTSCLMSFSSIGCPAPVACSDIFPGSTSFAVNGASTFFSFGNPSICNGGSCEPVPTFTVPVIPSTIPFSSFSTTSISDGIYQQTSWGLGANSTVNFSGSGTAVLYFNQSITIPSGTQINPSGSPENVLIVVNGALTIQGGTTINANIYASGSMTIGSLFSGTSNINGALSIGGALSVWGEGNFNFDSSYISNMDSKGFCEGTSPPSLDHFQIIHDGSGLTCGAETVTIKACTNAYDGTCTLSTDSVSLDVNAVGTSTVTNNISFTGSTTTNISYTTPETIVLSISNPTIAPTSSTVCNDNSVGSCNLVFDDTGFRFLVDGSDVDISTQIAGKPSNSGYGMSTLALQAIKTNTNTGACEVAITSNVNIEIAAKCENPVLCAGEQVVINSTSVPTLNNASTLSYANVSLDFGSNSDNTAEFNFTYPDVGQVKLYARYNIPVDGSPSGNYMIGNSNSFVVRPFGFHMNIAPDGSNDTTNPKATDASGDKFKKAGENFEVIVSAVQWQSSDDDGLPSGTANDGIPDSNIDLKSNPVTPNFGNESTAAEVELIQNLVAPSGGVLGSLTGGLYSGFTTGVKSQNINWDEVGIISLTARLESNGNYLSTSTVSTIEPYVGRFTPDHFELGGVENGDLISVCAGIPSAYTYIGEMDQTQPTDGALKYGVEPEFTITAKSAICPSSICTTTTNYTGNFVKLLESSTGGKGINKVVPLTDSVKTGTIVPAEKLAILADVKDNYPSPTTIPESNGVLTYTYNSTDNFVYTRNSNAKIEPFDSDIDLVITSIIDEDEITAWDFNGPSVAGILTLHPVGTNIRFGRWHIENAYGPETENLPIAMTIQHWDGNKFITNTDESCITPATITNPDDKIGGAIWSGGMTEGQYRLVDLDGADSLGTSHTNGSVSGTFANGSLSLPEGEFLLSAPSNGAQGTLQFEYEVPTWLKYDWKDQDGTFDDNPTGRITFGIFRGNDRIISWREVGN